MKKNSLTFYFAIVATCLLIGWAYFYSANFHKDNQNSISRDSQELQFSAPSAGPCQPPAGTVSSSTTAVPQTPREEYLRGQAYDRGIAPFKKDMGQALCWYQLAANHGQAEAQYALAALAYYGSPGDQRDLEKAVQLFRQAANEGDTHAMLALANIYEKGDIGIDKDETTAAIFILQAAIAKSAEGQLRWAEICESGLMGRPRDPAQAYYWLQESAKQNNPAAQYRMAQVEELGQLGRKPDDKAALPWLQSAASNNVPAAQNRLGEYHQLGLAGLAADDEQAFKYFSAAAAKFNPAAINNIGNLYKAGFRGDPDLRKACDQYRQASELGYASATFNYGRCYFDDTRSTELNQNEAVELLKRASQQGVGEASKFLKARKLDKLG